MNDHTFVKLLQSLQHPRAYQRLVDALPAGRTRWLLQCWGILNGHYHDRQDKHHPPPANPPYD